MDVKAFIADLARPWVLWSGGASASVATVICAWRGENMLEGAALLTAAWAGVAGIYWGKSFENRGVEASKASVEVVRAQASPPPAAALAAAPTPSDDGELPLDQRVRR